MTMYEEASSCFDPNLMAAEGADMDGLCQAQVLLSGSTTNSNNTFEDSLKISMEDEEVLEIHIQNQLAFNTGITHLMQDSTSQHQVLPCDHLYNDWETDVVVQDVHTLLENCNNFSANNTPSPLQATLPYNPTPSDILNVFHLPSCSSSTNSLLPDSSMSFLGDLDLPMPADTASILFQLSNLNPTLPPFFREQLPPHAYSLPTGFFGTTGGREIDQCGGGSLNQEGDRGDGVLEFSGDVPCIGKGIRKAGKMTKHFATERQRREHLNDKYKALRNLVPNPTKNDRASVVGDAIEYIQELLRSVKELKLLVDKKMCGSSRRKRHKTEEAACGDVGSSNIKPFGDNGSLWSSWLQSKAKDVEVDVRIIDGEATIKLVHSKTNCLLRVSKVIDELKLDLNHFSGGHIGDYDSLFFNTKVCEGSCLCASEVAKRLIDSVAERPYAPAPSSSCYNEGGNL